MAALKTAKPTEPKPERVDDDLESSTFGSEVEKINDKKAVVAAITGRPTASDIQIATMTGADNAFVTDVRAQLGPKHSWPKPKEDKD